MKQMASRVLALHSFIFVFILSSAFAEEAKSSLNGTEWEIQLTPSNKKEKGISDTLAFDKGKVTSKHLATEGFPTSNYTLTAHEGEKAVVWETMQTSEAEGLGFWHGEVTEQSMRGVLSLHPVKGDPRDYSFVGQRTKGSEAAPPLKAEVAPPTVKPAVVKSTPQTAVVKPVAATSKTIEVPQATKPNKHRAW